VAKRLDWFDELFETLLLKFDNKYLGPQHFADRYSVFSYSLSQQGVFCKPCVLFAPDSVRSVKLDRLVKSPLKDYSHLTGNNGYLTCHLRTEFHEDGVTKASAFVKSFHKQSDVAQQLNAAAAAEINKTRMWANAQPDGRPAEHRWRPLFNAAKFS